MIGQAKGEGAESLTGIWQGLYSYPSGSSVSFVATLIDSGSSFSGSIQESCGFRSGRTLSATLEGTREGGTISFRKVYQDGGPLYAATVSYEGTLSSDATEIEGRWTIWKIYSGKFLMIRPGRKEAEVEHKQSERV